MSAPTASTLALSLVLALCCATAPKPRSQHKSADDVASPDLGLECMPRHLPPAPTSTVDYEAGAAIASAIYGHVVDEKGAAVEGATITVTSPSIPGLAPELTDAHGRYHFRVLPEGDYTIMVFYADIEVKQPSVNVSDEHAARVRFILDAPRHPTEVPTADRTLTPYEEWFFRELRHRARSRPGAIRRPCRARGTTGTSHNCEAD